MTVRMSIDEFRRLTGQKLVTRGKFNTPVRTADKPTMDGFIFDSRREMDIYFKLKTMKEMGEVHDFQVKPHLLRVYLKPPSTIFSWPQSHKERDWVLLFRWRPDFKVIHRSGYGESFEYWDCKGFHFQRGKKYQYRDRSFEVRLRILRALKVPIKIIN
ncbi:MAG: DUF1064 domain-containing protein [candidate division Zixibacteria bacterium]|nr:DUF1064 domain-containing protein [candidate division Zixibacteria bacterium]